MVAPSLQNPHYELMEGRSAIVPQRLWHATIRASYEYLESNDSQADR